MFDKFPINYKQRYSSMETISYISKYLNEIHNYFTNEKKMIYLDAPLVFNTEYSPNTIFSNKRKINFDSKFDNEIYEFYDSIELPINKFLQNNIKENKLSIYTYYSKICRDEKQTDISGIVAKNFYVETQVVEEEITMTNIQSMATHYIECIKKWNKKVDLHFNITEQKYTNFEINFTTSQDIQNTIKWGSFEKKINDYVEKNQVVLVSNISWKNQQGEMIVGENNVFSENQYSSMLFIWDKISKKAIQVLKVTPHSIEGKNTNEIASIAIEIFFTNLMKINLEKFHISEVVNSPWSKIFYENIKNKKIEIL